MKYQEESNPKSRLMLSKGWGEGRKWGVNCSMSLQFPFGVEKSFGSMERVVVQHCEGTKCHWIIHFKIANFIFPKFHQIFLIIKEKWEQDIT